MPRIVRVAEWLNHAFSREEIGNFNPEVLAPGGKLVDALKSHRVRLSREETQFISSLPPSQQEAMRAALYSAVLRKVPVTFAWAPGYDYEFTLWEAAGSGRGRGAMTILLRTPKPVYRKRPSRKRATRAAA